MWGRGGASQGHRGPGLRPFLPLVVSSYFVSSPRGLASALVFVPFYDLPHPHFPRARLLSPPAGSYSRCATPAGRCAPSWTSSRGSRRRRQQQQRQPPVPALPLRPQFTASPILSPPPLRPAPVLPSQAAAAAAAAATYPLGVAPLCHPARHSSQPLVRAGKGLPRPRRPRPHRVSLRPPGWGFWRVHAQSGAHNGLRGRPRREG